MGLKSLFLRNKLQSAEREAKKLHGLQRRVRTQLDDLNQQKRKGMDAAKYEDRKAKLETRRHEIIEKLKHVEEKERQLRAEVKSTS